MGELSRAYIIEGIEELYIENLRSRCKVLVHDTLESIAITGKYHQLTIDDSILEALLNRARKAKQRSEAVGYLQGLIELKYIDELEALAVIDEWIEMEYY